MTCSLFSPAMRVGIDVDTGDWRANDAALVSGTRLLSAYRLRDGTRIWIITEADRSSTTILVPDEY
jgi:hypothetical protein